MKKMLLVLFLLSSVSFAQYWEGGLQINPTLSANEFSGYKISYVIRGLARYNFSENFIGEIGFGAGKYAGKDWNDAEYSTTIIPFDVRLNYAFFKSDSYYPYLYVGVGSLIYNVTKKSRTPQWPKKAVEESGITAVVPAGVGVMIQLCQYMSLDLSAGFNYSFTDNLNYYRDGSPKDAYYNLGIGLVYGHQWVDPDDDNDGLLNKEEKELGTDPLKADTDGDGLNDGEEVRTYATNPLATDTDKDGLTDSEEVTKHKTNPLVMDTDGDGLIDGEEINTTKTDPNNKDTDKDSLSDSEEINTYKTNPLKADTDGDTLKDNVELMSLKTNPLSTDTDGDGLSDSEEVNNYKTNPLAKDTDGDELFDNDEIVKYKTNPLLKDSDAGTVNDNVEVTRGTDPLDSSDDVIKVGVPMILEGITFKSGSADITPESEVSLQKALRTLNGYPELIVVVNGYTDNVGGKKSNIKLSQRRADSVKDWLVKNGIDVARLTTKGYGPANPIAPNTTNEGKLKNRRIEFVRVK
ncbi:MAG: OmpA family protein [bacterium]